VQSLERLGAQLEDSELSATLRHWLTEDEVTATRIRIEMLLRHKVHPYPPDDWPAVPWPPI